MAAVRSVDDHLIRILQTVDPLPPYEQPLLEAVGLPVYGDVESKVPVPGFDNSAMDGYAVRLEDVRGASEREPVRLPVTGESAAGTSKPTAVSPGQAVKIMTGAPMPSGADCVVPVEWTDAGHAYVSITQAPQPRQHVRYEGEDLKAGDVVVPDGTTLGPREVAVLAATGHATVQARPRPRVVILSTGSELRDPGTRLGYDSIYDSNSFCLAAAVQQAGAIAYRVGIIPDDAQTFADSLSDQLVRADVVVTSGGVSKGEYDIVKDVLSRLGTVEFTEVAMQPGKPQGFGTVGEDATPIFTLPGNAVSTFVSFEVFVLPALRRMMGKLPYRRPMVRAKLAEDITKPQGRQMYARGTFEVTARGPVVTPHTGHGSHMVGALAQSNSLVLVPADTDSLKAGSSVDVLVLDRSF